MQKITSVVIGWIVNHIATQWARREGAAAWLASLIGWCAGGAASAAIMHA